MFTNEETRGIIRIGGKTEEIVQFILNRRTEVLQNSWNSCTGDDLIGKKKWDSREDIEPKEVFCLITGHSLVGWSGVSGASGGVFV